MGVSLSRLFPEILSGLLLGTDSGSLDFDRVANRRFHASWLLVTPPLW